MKSPIYSIPLQPFIVKKQVDKECVFGYECEIIPNAPCCYKCERLQVCKGENLDICDDEFMCPVWEEHNK
jgi:hypothetical protein